MTTLTIDLETATLNLTSDYEQWVFLSASALPAIRALADEHGLLSDLQALGVQVHKFEEVGLVLVEKGSLAAIRALFVEHQLLSDLQALDLQAHDIKIAA